MLGRGEKQICPRRILDLGSWGHDLEPKDTWDVRTQFASPGALKARHCSFCGSLHPDDLMAGLRDGSLHIGGSDKGYKWYIGRALTDQEKADIKLRWLDTDGVASMRRSEGAGPAELEDLWRRYGSWRLEPTPITKFYTPHLGREHAQELIELWRAHKLSHSMYVQPWFPSLADDAPPWLTRD